MKRTSLLAAGAFALALAAPGAAAAHHARGHHASRARGHHHHAAAARVVTFTSASSRRSADATAPSSEPAPDTAGTISSFSGGVLAITLSDGTVVSGKLTERTEIECSAAATETSGDGERGESGDGDHGSGGDEVATAASEKTSSSAGESSDGGGDEGSESAGEETCTTAALVAGALVREAELRISSEGAVWLKVELG